MALPPHLVQHGIPSMAVLTEHVCLQEGECSGPDHPPHSPPMHHMTPLLSTHSEE